MDFKLHIETAWKLTLKYIVPLILITLTLGVISFFSFGILAPVMMAGYMQSILMMIRTGREPKIQDIFSEMRLFVPLLVFGIVTAIVIAIGFSLFFLPGIVLTLGITFICLYVLPLMTDRNFDVVDAVKESFRMVRGDDILDHVIVAILFVGIGSIGGSVFIGWLFTLPLSTVFLMLVYEEQTSGVPPMPPRQDPPPPESTDRQSNNDGSDDDEIVIKYKA